MHQVSAFIHHVLKLPVIRKFKNRFPKLYGFIKARLSITHFFGLPFTFVLFLIWLTLSLLTELAESIENSAVMKAIDKEISMRLFNARLPWLNELLFAITEICSFHGLVVVTVLSGLFMLVKRKFIYLLGFLVSVLGSGAAVKIIKAYFVRERPLDIGYYPETSFSFPSGHATAAMALEGFLFYLLILESKTHRQRIAWLFCAAVFIFLIGFSRIYLGVHFASDVIAGWALGFLWLLFGIIIMEYATLRKNRVSEK